MSADPFHICDRGERSALYDARGIFCCYVCDTCETEKRGRYRPEIFEDSNYAANEEIDPD